MTYLIGIAILLATFVTICVTLFLYGMGTIWYRSVKELEDIEPEDVSYKVEPPSPPKGEEDDTQYNHFGW